MSRPPVTMSERSIGECRYDFFPDNYQHRRNETAEQARDRRLNSLKDSIAYYAGKLAAIRAAKPGDVIGCIVHDVELLVKVEAGLVKQLDRVAREYRDLAMAETNAACDRASGYGWRSAAE